MVETYFFFSWSSVSVCVHGGWVLLVDRTWDMMGPDLTGVCLARFAFFFIHFSAYTEKDQGGWIWVWVGFGLLVHHIFFIFSGTHVW